MRNEMLVVISMKSEHLRRRVSSTTIDSSADRSKSRLLCVVVVNSGGQCGAHNVFDKRRKPEFLCGPPAAVV